MTAVTQRDAHHYNPFVAVGGARIGYHRCRSHGEVPTLERHDSPIPGAGICSLRGIGKGGRILYRHQTDNRIGLALSRFYTLRGIGKGGRISYRHQTDNRVGLALNRFYTLCRFSCARMRRSGPAAPGQPVSLLCTWRQIARCRPYSLPEAQQVWQMWCDMPRARARPGPAAPGRLVPQLCARRQLARIHLAPRHVGRVRRRPGRRRSPSAGQGALMGCDNRLRLAGSIPVACEYARYVWHANIVNKTDPGVDVGAQVRALHMAFWPLRLRLHKTYVLAHPLCAATAAASL